MSTQPQATAPARTRPPVIRITPGQANFTTSWTRMIPAWIISVVLNVMIIALFGVTLLLGSSRANGPEVDATTAAVETTVEDPTDKSDLTNPEIGIDPTVPLAYDTDRVEDVSVPGTINPDQAIGMPGAPADAPQANIPAPPGFGNQGLGKGVQSDVAGTANLFGEAGGSGGLFMPGGFGGRSGATRERLAITGGGNAASEASVAEGLLWLARHQAADGHWSLNHFNRNANLRFPDPGRVPDDGSKGEGTQDDDVAGTAFGLLPFLGAGETHKPPPAGTKKANSYTKVVEAGLRYLVRKQTSEGQFPGTMYSHGLATIAVCEAYGLTSDPLLKPHAQKAINFIAYAQNPTTGGWRYAPRTDGDTSVVGWQVMALKSGQMAGLSVPRSTLELAGKWLDGCMTKDKGGYGYLNNEEKPTMTAVGLLCREYLGWSPKNPGILAGVDRLVPKDSGGKRHSSVATNNMYYNYYATQVLHHFGGDAWEQVWNPSMRDLLVKTQDRGANLNQRGSWDPNNDVLGKVGGRVMVTSLSLLTLEVYYRHLPLYRRETGTTKDAAP